jgi:hypothetical protein
MNAKPAAAIFLSVAALAGGAGGAVVASTRDADVRTATVTTTTDMTPGATAAVADATTTTLTAGEIYKNASKGVVDLVVSSGG